MAKSMQDETKPVESKDITFKEKFSLTEGHNIVFDKKVDAKDLNVKDDEQFVVKIIDGIVNLIKVKW